MNPQRGSGERPVTKEVPHQVLPYAGGDEMLRLVQRVFLSNEGSARRQVLFCGVSSQNGSSSVCANAGKALATYNSRTVCLVDANVHSSSLLGLLGGDKLMARRKPATVREQCIAITENLWFAGPDLLTDENGGLLSLVKLERVFAELGAMFDFVLIDAPAPDISGDAALIGQVADGAILVIDAEVTRRITARKAKESLEAANVRLLGAVLYDRLFPIPKGLYDRL